MTAHLTHAFDSCVASDFGKAGVNTTIHGPRIDIEPSI